MKQLFLVPACLVVSLTSCDRNEEENSSHWTDIARVYPEALAQFSFSCDLSKVPADSRYFTGKINGSEVCYVEGDKEYQMYSGYDRRWLSGSTIPPNYDTYTETSAYLFGMYSDIETVERLDFIMPGSPEFTNAQRIVESSLRLGELPLASNEKSQLQGYTVEITFLFEPEDTTYQRSFYWIKLTSAFGEQEGGRLAVTQLNKVETDTTILYDLTIELDCKLYWQRSDEEMAYFGDLVDGVFKTSIVVDK